MSQKMYSFNLKDTIKSFQLLPKIFRLLWSVKKNTLISIILLQSINGVIPSITVLATQYLLNALQSSINKDFNYVLYPLLIYISINFLGYITSVINGYLQSIYRIDLSYKTEVMVLDQVKKLSLSDFENSEVYDQLRRAQNNASDKPFQVFSTLLGILSQFLGLIAAVAILSFWKPWIILLALLIPIISTVCMAQIGHEQYQIEFERAPKRRKTWYLNYLMTNDIAYKEIKLYKLGDYFLNHYKKLASGFIGQDKKIIKKRTITSILLELVDQVMGGFILLMIVLAAYGGEILIGNTVAYIRSLSNIKANTIGLLNSVTSLYQSNLHIKQLFDFLELPTQEDDLKNVLEEKIIIEEINEIEFKNVSFKYPNKSEHVLKNITFHVKKGENISIVGQNGSGKSTLVKLLSGFYDNYEGEILINGISTRRIKEDSLKNKIGVIFQDFNKYELSCRENIGLGNLDYLSNDEKIEGAIGKSYAQEIIDRLPNGVDTQLGVWFGGGVQLSGGEWQRIALARAFLRDSDCYILDEPSSALDPVSENEILKNTAELTKDKISIFISHRLYNLRRISSRILVLKEGVLVEEGSHDYLINQNGHYSYLYNLKKEVTLDIGLESNV